VPKINMGPFESKSVISEIQIQKGQWIPTLTGKPEGIKAPFSMFLLVILAVVSIVGFLSYTQKKSTH
jgi:hypothetical protein